jgi:SAM-dependent methyltransferase
LSSPRVAAYYKRNFLPIFKSLPKDASILELGCGAGNFLAILKEAGFCHCEGIDVSQEQVDLAKEQGLPVSSEDVFDHLDKLSDRYAAIVAIDFFEHFSKSELVKLGQLLSKALETGGILILQTPNGKSPFALRNIYGDLTHLTIFSDESIGQWLGAAGFSNIRIFSPHPALVNWKDSIRVFGRKLILVCLWWKTFLVTGRRESVLGENLIAVAEKNPDPPRN